MRRCVDVSYGLTVLSSCWACAILSHVYPWWVVLPLAFAWGYFCNMWRDERSRS